MYEKTSSTCSKSRAFEKQSLPTMIDVIVDCSEAIYKRLGMEALLTSKGRWAYPATEWCTFAGRDSPYMGLELEHKNGSVEFCENCGI
jgi:hypothetical protein